MKIYLSPKTATVIVFSGYQISLYLFSDDRHVRGKEK